MSAKREGPRRKLPTGIQNFREIREDDCYYVDKAAFIRRLVDEGKHYFLSRPRRFGKSLFLDTVKELFEGSEALFEGLDVHAGWDWSVRHPVVRLDFSSGHFAEPDGLHTNLMTQLAAIERRTGVGSDHATAPERFGHLITALCELTGQRVVVLVDEYDKPILDALEKPEVARANRDYLRGLYSTIKFADAQIKFTLLTGVSKFSKVSLFSGLNNLVDITLEPEYSTICGYTDADLDHVFAPELPGLDAAPGVLLPLRRGRARRDGRGQRQPRARRHDRSPRGRRLPVRVQGGGAGRRGRGDGAVEGERLRRQAPRPRSARAAGGGGAQPASPQPGVVRGGTRLRTAAGVPADPRDGQWPERRSPPAHPSES